MNMHTLLQVQKSMASCPDILGGGGESDEMTEGLSCT